MSQNDSTPSARIRLTAFLALTGLSKTTFYHRFRHDPHWIEWLDLRIDRAGRLHFSEDRARRFRASYLGGLAHDRSERADHLLRRCKDCEAFLGPRSRFCSQCGAGVES